MASSVDEKLEYEKKIVSEAVQFLLRNSVNGVVPLCASLAELIKEKDIMAKKIATLTRQIETLQECLLSQPHASQVDSTNRSSSVLIIENRLLKIYDEKLSNSESSKHQLKSKETQEINKNKCKTRIARCLCKSCCSSSRIDVVEPPLKLDDKILIRGEITGTVKYVGHLDFCDHAEIFVGLQLNVPIGDSNGTKGKKTYFTSPHKYGLFVSLLDVLCVIQ